MSQAEFVTLPEVAALQRDSGRMYVEFLRRASLSVGLYRIPAGGDDPQQPHTEDEVYYVVGGRGSLTVGEATVAVEAGSIAFVAAGEVHRFTDVTEELEVLVFFAPAEGSSGS